MLFADLLAVVGWFIVRANGGLVDEFPLSLSALYGLGGWNVLFFCGRACLKARAGA